MQALAADHARQLERAAALGTSDANLSPATPNLSAKPCSSRTTRARSTWAARDKDLIALLPLTAHRATQDVPPAVRRAVLRRDHGRCRVPGCRNATFLEVHHIVPRAEGGGHHAGNLLTVCGAHHRALHRGELAVEGDAASSSFRHADGSFYGGVANPKTLDLSSKLFSALRGLGFREAEVRAVLGELRAREELHGAPTQEWLRAALRWLTPVQGARARA